MLSILEEVNRYMYKLVNESLGENFNIEKLKVLANNWQSLYIDYERPIVHRLWRQWNDYRICLHRILPCEYPYYHPHPWPSAMKIFKGSYLMKVGYGDPFGAPPPTGTVIHLKEGSSYQMVDPMDWHSVQPLEECVTLMVIGKKWNNVAHPAKPARMRSLTEAEASSLLMEFVEIPF